MKFIIPVTLFLACSIALKSQAQNACAEDRLAGFAEQKRKDAEFAKQRETGADEIKKKREDWNQTIQNSVDEYRSYKRRQASGVGDNSAEYLADLEKKKQEDRQLELARQQYVRSKATLCAQGSQAVSEMEELGLKDTGPRVEFKKRTLFGSAKGATPARGNGRGNGNGSTDLGAPPPPADFNAPPPPPAPLPEFYEPEAPPPPPPMPPEFDEPIPPPVFEDPEF